MPTACCIGGASIAAQNNDLALPAEAIVPFLRPLCCKDTGRRGTDQLENRHFTSSQLKVRFVLEKVGGSSLAVLQSVGCGGIMSTYSLALPGNFGEWKDVQTESGLAAETCLCTLCLRATSGRYTQDLRVLNNASQLLLGFVGWGLRLQFVLTILSGCAPEALELTFIPRKPEGLEACCTCCSAGKIDHHSTVPPLLVVTLHL